MEQIQIGQSIESKEKEPKRVVVYHAWHGGEFPNEDQQYIGSDRQELSRLLGGKVGFAYVHLPDGWAGNKKIFEVKILPGSICVLSLNMEDVPRSGDGRVSLSFDDCLKGNCDRQKIRIGNVTEYQGVIKFKHILNGREVTQKKHYAIGPIGELKKLYSERRDLGEVVFLADDAVFGKSLEVTS